MTIAEAALEILQNKNPDETLWSFKLSEVLKAVKGTYVLSHGHSAMKVELIGGVLKAIISGRGRDESDGFQLTLMIKDLDALVFSVCSNEEYPKTIVEFFRDEDSGLVAQVLWDRAVFCRD